MTKAPGRDAMPIWQRLLITLAVMLLTSYLVGLLWHWLFNSDIPSYLSGAVGGLSAVPTWEFLRRIRPKHYGDLRAQFHFTGLPQRQSAPASPLDWLGRVRRSRHHAVT